MTPERAVTLALRTAGALLIVLAVLLAAVVISPDVRNSCCTGLYRDSREAGK